MRYLAEPPHSHGAIAKTGILLINLGTPDAPTPPAVRRYLKEFLSDPRVVEIPRLAWWPILNGIILNTRPRQSAKKYATIWMPEGSPLMVHTERQARLLAACLGKLTGAPLEVAWAMRYGSPAVPDTLARLKAAGCERILVLPLYPQYSASATASAFDAVAQCMTQIRNVPELRLVRHFHDHPAYIAALAASVREYWDANGRAEHLVMSFHGLPQYTLERGDPYHCECHKSARLLAEALGLAQNQWQLSFQSRFGRTPWLKPYTTTVLAELAQGGVRRVDVLCPGFVSDCLETLEEIAMAAKATFLGAGGQAFHFIACLNERDDWIRALAGLALEHLGSWASTGGNGETASAAALASAQRALSAGANT